MWWHSITMTIQAVPALPEAPSQTPSVPLQLTVWPGAGHTLNSEA